MTSKITATLLATALTCGVVGPALAQSAEATYAQRLDAYNDQRNSYYDQVADYRDRQAAYERDRSNYTRTRDDYDRRYGVGAYDRRYPTYAERYRTAQYRQSAEYYREQANFDRDRARYERARYDYDRRYGSGAYDRRNPREATRFRLDGGVSYTSGYDAQRSQWERDRDAYLRSRDDYDRRYGAGAYDRRNPNDASRYSAPYAGGSYSSDVAYNAPCRVDAKKNATAGGVIGALVGGVVGSNAAARNAKPEGTVLGALVGAGVGAAIGNSTAKSKCDTRGAYWSYDETIPYRETAYNSSSDYAGNRYYERCRLAPAPTEYNGRTESRYVRVCPDSEGRFRVEG